ncbi:MAG: hypothetical protein JXX29_10825 [Deltaproteobacteria bacterium]|nr:hypothetical protein [Deltaproteobacteria bacterium]MBN2672162.1 hypothetical protein [Deltaproteobacteria bacterium]
MVKDTGNDQKWKGKRDRDDTPSFIRNVDSRSSMLQPGRTSIPVLAVPTSIRIWNKIRWPLAVITAVIVLAVVGFFTNDILVSKNVEQRVKDSFIGEESAHVQVLLESNRVLRTMSEKYSDRLNVQAAFAWNTMLVARLFGEDKTLIKQADDAFDAIEDDTSSIGMAANAVRLIFAGDLKTAQSAINDGLTAHDTEPRIHLADAWLKLAQHNTDSGVKKLTELRERFPEYLPPLYTLIEVGISRNDNLSIATYSAELLTASTGNLFGALTSLLVRLPGWNKDPLSAAELQELVSVQKDLREQVKTAPKKLQIYSSFMEGRIQSELGNYKQAIEIFKPMLDDSEHLNILAWYGKAIMEERGPRAALDALASAGETPPFEIHDLRARAYLSLYNVAEAEKAISALTGQVDYDLSELKWLLAVRKGDSEEAKKTVPKTLSKRLQTPALEMYDLIRRTGDKDGIDAITSAMTAGGLTDCADAIGHWHNNRLHKLFHLFGNSTDSCVIPLSLRLMKDNYSPETLTELVRRLPKGPGLIQTQVDKTLVTWKTKGYAAALKELNEIAANNYETGPLITAIAEAYLRMEQYQKVIDLTQNSNYPEAVALQYHGLIALNQKKQASALLQKYGEDDGTQDHPAIKMLILDQKKDTGNAIEIIESVDSAIGQAGIWTAEMAEIKAVAMSALGERGDADRYLTAMIKSAGRAGGMSESWEVQKAIIRINLRRGGNFLFKAVAYTVDLYKSKVEDAEVTFSYGVESQRQGNERGAVRYFNDTIELDPTYTPAYIELNKMEELTEELTALLQLFRPNAKL